MLIAFYSFGRRAGKDTAGESTLKRREIPDG